jgi:iduronate 2-sulfatase
MLALGAAGISSCKRASNSERESPAVIKRPNVLLIMVDDLNGSLSCFGNSVVRSPNIDRLAARGVKFERAYCQYPVCNPSRTSMLSGLRPARTGVMTNGSHLVPDRGDPPLLPSFLKEQGYLCARVGKIFHESERMLEGKPMRSTDDPGGWDISEDERSVNEEDEMPGGNQAQEGPEWKISKLDVADEETGDGYAARRAVRIMQEKLAGDRPFFLAVGFRKPHLPWAAPGKYFDLYPAEKMVPPTVTGEHLKALLPVAVNKRAGEEVSEQQAKEFIAAYYACVSFMDAQVGLILDALKRMKLVERTLVIFASDHGFHLGEHGLWGKSTLFEQSARTPLILAGPGVVKGGACERTVELLDVYPTVVDLCGLSKVERLQGMSLRPLLARPDAPWNRPAYSWLRHDRVLGKSVRTERHRYTEWDGGKEGVELYDYQSDPQELKNLAKDEGAARVLDSMRNLLK